MFIPKCGSSYTDLGILDPPVSHHSYLRPGKGWVDGYLRDNALALMPLHPNQHAYHGEKSMDIVTVRFCVENL